MVYAQKFRVFEARTKLNTTIPICDTLQLYIFLLKIRLYLVMTFSTCYHIAKRINLRFSMLRFKFILYRYMQFCFWKPIQRIFYEPR